MLSKPCKTHPELLERLAKAKDLPPMTKMELAAQRKSWVIGNMMIKYPQMTREEAERIYDKVSS